MANRKIGSDELKATIEINLLSENTAAKASGRLGGPYPIEQEGRGRDIALEAVVYHPNDQSLIHIYSRSFRD